MESLLNFNFLKDTSLKKNNKNNTNDKSLSVDGKDFGVIHHDGIENEFNNILSNQELNESSLSSEKKKSNARGGSSRP